MRKHMAIWLGKAIKHSSQKLNRGGGSAAPGLYALKLHPELIFDLAKDIKQNFIITGTNGKTTTARMIAQIAHKQGLSVIRNTTGSNLERGIASTLVAHASPMTGKVKADLGIWELDEAAFNHVAPLLKPNCIVFLNVFRDQLDRYGEVDSVVTKWQKTLPKLSKDCLLLINADDQSLLKLQQDWKGKKQLFGTSQLTIKDEALGVEKRQVHYDIQAIDIKPQGLEGTKLEIQDKQNIYKINLPIPGLYHVYDFLAAFAVSKLLDIDPGLVQDAMEHFSPAFGRVEKFTFKQEEIEKNGYIFLIKNPAGTTQVLQTLLLDIRNSDRVLVALNDNFADGTDVSWIWDAEFELLTRFPNLQFICSGSRAYDMALRLKYAGIHPECIIVHSELKKAFQEAKKGISGRLFILPTYTALLEIQSILSQLRIKKAYWKDA